MTKAIARGLVQLALNVGVALVIGLVLALGSALIHSGPFLHRFGLACALMGAFALLLATAGQQRSYRNIETYGRVPNMPAWFQVEPGDTTVSTGAVFAVTGIVLLVLAAVFF
jgi:hypothetical protein